MPRLALPPALVTLSVSGSLVWSSPDVTCGAVAVSSSAMRPRSHHNRRPLGGFRTRVAPSTSATSSLGLVLVLSLITWPLPSLGLALGALPLTVPSVAFFCCSPTSPSACASGRFASSSVPPEHGAFRSGVVAFPPASQRAASSPPPVACGPPAVVSGSASGLLVPVDAANLPGEAAAGAVAASASAAGAAAPWACAVVDIAVAAEAWPTARVRATTPSLDPPLEAASDSGAAAAKDSVPQSPVAASLWF